MCVDATVCRADGGREVKRGNVEISSDGIKTDGVSITKDGIEIGRVRPWGSVPDCGPGQVIHLDGRQDRAYCPYCGGNPEWTESGTCPNCGGRLA